ncbi:MULTISPECIES: hypothetical protein [Streptomyces]|uniref:Integral membrane protein n=1 Tax=Streptomyces lycii TaxID=2654337 RepID=A0ABQ7FBW3_9ACTN|nr:hypothetical protein [Streptomyces lycii]KAF4406052.1 hypothetical protein GCU69_27100 [Streptomyces lycii]
MSVPPARAGAGLRLVRAAVFAAVCVVLSGGGHALASLGHVPLWALGAGFLAALAAAASFAGRERSLPGIAGALAAGQLALHTVFGYAQHGAATPAAPPGHGGTSHHQVTALAQSLLCNGGPISPAEAGRVVAAAGITPATGAPGAGGAPAALSGGDALTGALLPSLPMLLAHLLAAVVLGLLLRRGEAALFRLVRLSVRELAAGAPVRALRAALALARALHGGLPDCRGPRAGISGAYGPGTAGPQVLALEHSVSRRGPPALGLAA